MKKIYKIYKTLEEATSGVEELLLEGYDKNQIQVISSKEVEHMQDDRDLWDKIKDAFTFHKYNVNYFDSQNVSEEDRILLRKYISNLEEGETLILVEEDKTAPSYDTSINQKSSGPGPISEADIHAGRIIKK